MSDRSVAIVYVPGHAEKAADHVFLVAAHGDAIRSRDVGFSDAGVVVGNAASKFYSSESKENYISDSFTCTNNSFCKGFFSEDLFRGLAFCQLSFLVFDVLRSTDRRVHGILN